MNTKRHLQLLVIVTLILMTLSPISATALSPVLYVVQGGQTSGACDSWANACELQYALTSAVSGQEIWVPAGVYKPTTNPTNPKVAFSLKSGVGLYGGFVGSETTRDQRDWQTNKTILSGDIDNNDINDDGNFIAETTADIQGNNSYHVTVGSNTDSTAVLDGFIVTAGQANPYYSGGGMYNYNGSPTITNVIFSTNLADKGGGMYNYGGNPALSNVSFSANLADSYGGGMYNEDSSPNLTNVTFSANSARIGGGGMYIGNSSPTLTNVIFSTNSTDSWGGGIYSSESSPTLLSVVFYSNVADIGGGMYSTGGNPNLTNVIFETNQASSSCGGMQIMSNYPTLKNVTFHANSANTYGGGGICNSGTLKLINSILWGNNATFGSQILEKGGRLIVSFTNVQGGWLGTGNIDADPLFVDSTNSDLHLQAGSPAIDSGTNADCSSTDFDGVSRPQDGNNDGIYACDMGAYEVEGNPGTPPVNDNFANATIITALPFSDVVNNIFATVEPDEPHYCTPAFRTIWYKFTPAANIQVRVNAEGSNFTDNILTVYQETGTGFGGLNEINCISGGGSFTFSAQAGVTYYIKAGSINSFGGDLHVNLQEILPPLNDNFANATIITALPFTDIVDNTSATVEPDEPQPCDTSLRTVWYAFTPAVNTEIRMNTEGSVFNDTVLVVYQDTGNGLGGLNPFTCTSWGGTLTFNAQAGVTYYIQTGYMVSSGELHLNVREVPPPPNDDFANATMISSPLPFDGTMDAAGATLEASEPNSWCAWYGSLWKTVWYAYTPSTDGWVTASVPTATFAPVITAYTGNSLTELAPLGCQMFWNSRLTVPVKAGTTYYFQVGKFTWWDADGDLQFNLQEVQPPSNDDFANAKIIPSPLPFDDMVDMSDTSLETGEPNSWCAWYGSLWKTVWYAYTPEYGGVISASVPAAAFAPVLSAYDSSSFPYLNQLDCQVFSGNELILTVDPGSTYYFQIGKLTPWDPEGGIQFNLRKLLEVTKISAPLAPVRIGQSIDATVEFNDPDVGDTHTVDWDWGDGSTSTGPASPPSGSASHTYLSTGVYTVTATITDSTGASYTVAFQYVVVYDPNGGFVTGGGWIDSPEGAYTPDPSLTGNATFGFVSKYQKGTSVPSGGTEFQFSVANLYFESTSYNWMIIAGTRAQYKGTGTINGAGSYGFMLTAIDGSPDMFRIKIWDKATDEVIYDNMLGAADSDDPVTAIGGGSIIIHKPK